MIGLVEESRPSNDEARAAGDAGGPPAPSGPRLIDYQAARRDFRWSAARRELAGADGDELNIAAAVLDRHIAAGRGGELAVRFVDRAWNRTDLSYAQLQAASSRFANLLIKLGVDAGECVCALLGRCPELHIAALGTLRSGAVFCPLFTAFGPEPIRTRLAMGEAVVIVTTATLYRRKVAPLRAQLPKLRFALLVRDTPCEELPPDALDLAVLLADSSEDCAPARTCARDPALLHFTSGTTGKPKGVVHVHEAVVAHHATAQLALDLRGDDVFWCTADPGWVTGLSYGVIAPLSCGTRAVIDREDYDPARWYELLSREAVSVWYTAPTAIRMLIKAGVSLARSRTYPRLRLVASVGEPLNAEAARWGGEAFGHAVHDTWWQTETGAIMIAGFPGCELRPGSMGLAMPGVDIAVVRREPDGRITELGADQVGEIALRPGWPSMFHGYLHDEERYRAAFRDGWYLAGDLARRDSEGYFWFIGRADDVIKTAGHLIGPFEVESVLMTHPAVAQAAVIGLPDPIAGEAIKAFVELRVGHVPDEALRRALLGHARKLLGTALAPREIAFSEGLPRTRSGKIMRRLLRARELGLPEGDLSSLENPA